MTTAYFYLYALPSRPGLGKQRIPRQQLFALTFFMRPRRAMSMCPGGCVCVFALPEQCTAATVFLGHLLQESGFPLGDWPLSAYATLPGHMQKVLGGLCVLGLCMCARAPR